eukprot:NODE_353_length_8928_cov_0.455204.p9 type:complete len:115 gc:universal NODE_353_length_8928_cov_0.455204:210-554(+)
MVWCDVCLRLINNYLHVDFSARKSVFAIKTPEKPGHPNKPKKWHQHPLQQYVSTHGFCGVNHGRDKLYKDATVLVSMELAAKIKHIVNLLVQKNASHISDEDSTCYKTAHQNDQ